MVGTKGVRKVGQTLGCLVLFRGALMFAKEDRGAEIEVQGLKSKVGVYGKESLSSYRVKR